jgi:hypothetical protein
MRLGGFDGGVAGEDANHALPPLEFLVDPFQRFGGSDFAVVRAGKVGVGGHVGLGGQQQLGDLGEAGFEVSATVRRCALVEDGSRWAKIVSRRRRRNASSVPNRRAPGRFNRQEGRRGSTASYIRSGPTLPSEK